MYNLGRWLQYFYQKYKLPLENSLLPPFPYIVKTVFGWRSFDVDFKPYVL